MTKRRLIFLAIVTVFTLIAAACGDDDTSAGDSGGDDAADSGDDADDAGGDDAASQPGEGVSVTMARADWSTGYFQAYVYQALLTELGYDVSDPAELELGPSLAYLAMAEGDFDFWANSWYPGHLSWHDPELPDGTQVGDHITVVGSELLAGGLQGFLATKSFADEFGLKTMDDLNNNPDALAAFDAADPVPGNGIADMYGCQESWTCDNIILNQIAFSGWDNIQEVIAGYDAMVAEAIDKANSDVPMVIYTWTPSAFITNLIPGDNVVWLGVEEVLDDSNPTGQDGGESHDQRPGTSHAISEENCPMAADGNGCVLGWIAADIQVTANNDFLAANPAAAELLEQVILSVIDVSLANVAQDGGADTSAAIQGLASDWITTNRGLVDGWLDAARAAA